MSSIRRKDSNGGGTLGNEKSWRTNHNASFYGTLDRGSKIASLWSLSSSLVLANHHPLHAFPSMNLSLCDESSPSSSSSLPQPPLPPPQRFRTEDERTPLLHTHTHTHPHPHPHPPRLEEPPCSSCRYTGMTVCAGMSLYFLKLAIEEEPAASASATTARRRTAAATATIAGAAKTTVAATRNSTNKAFFCIGAVAWAVAGVYRSVLE
mmetsp:Transcript_24740/g.51181  ORF Transcript_24740/g.51181 Transcript_24740/m.51181 type:complete len:208 (+) Transcript_24740:256-879(+)